MRHLSGTKLTNAIPLSKEDAAAYDEEKVPFEVVVRKLVNTKPAHKIAYAKAVAKKVKPTQR